MCETRNARRQIDGEPFDPRMCPVAVGTGTFAHLAHVDTNAHARQIVLHPANGGQRRPPRLASRTSGSSRPQPSPRRAHVSASQAVAPALDAGLSTLLLLDRLASASAQLSP